MWVMALTGSHTDCQHFDERCYDCRQRNKCYGSSYMELYHVLRCIFANSVTANSVTLICIVLFSVLF